MNGYKIGLMEIDFYPKKLTSYPKKYTVPKIKDQISLITLMNLLLEIVS